MWARKGTALWGSEGGLCDIHQKDLTDHFLPHYFGIIVISLKHSFFPTQLLTATVLVWCWPPAMLINGFWIIFIHFAHFTHSTSCDLCSPHSSYFYLNCRASSEFQHSNCTHILLSLEMKDHLNFELHQHDIFLLNYPGCTQQPEKKQTSFNSIGCERINTGGNANGEVGGGQPSKAGCFPCHGEPICAAGLTGWGPSLSHPCQTEVGASGWMEEKVNGSQLAVAL